MGARAHALSSAHKSICAPPAALSTSAADAPQHRALASPGDGPRSRRAAHLADRLDLSRRHASLRSAAPVGRAPNQQFVPLSSIAMSEGLRLQSAVDSPSTNLLGTFWEPSRSAAQVGRGLAAAPAALGARLAHSDGECLPAALPPLGESHRGPSLRMERVVETACQLLAADPPRRARPHRPWRRGEGQACRLAQVSAGGLHARALISGRDFGISGREFGNGAADGLSVVQSALVVLAPNS